MAKLVVEGETRFGFRGHVYEPGIHDIQDAELAAEMHKIVHQHPFLRLYEGEVDAATLATGGEYLNESTPDGLPRRRRIEVQQDELPDELVESTPDLADDDVDRSDELEAGKQAIGPVDETPRVRSRRQIESKQE